MGRGMALHLHCMEVGCFWFASLFFLALKGALGLYQVGGLHLGFRFFIALIA
jgi:hypothetical protein